jgi:hypothetical protein
LARKEDGGDILAVCVFSGYVCQPEAGAKVP